MSEVRARWVEFKQLAAALATADDETSRLQMCVDSAPILIPGCDHAGVTLNSKDGLDTLVSSDHVVRVANELQFKLEEGPCLRMGRGEDTVLSNDLAHEERWPHWAHRVHADLGVHSMMSLLIYTDTQSYGALSLYASRGRAFDADDLAIAQGLAGHVAMIMAAGREIDQLGSAMHSRTIIGQAQGILMERFHVDADQAFDYLRRISSHANRKVIDVAADLVRTRTLPDDQPTTEPLQPEHVGGEGDRR